MRPLRAPGKYVLLGLLCALVLVVLTGCGGTYPQSTLSPKGDFSAIVDAVFMKTVYLATFVFILVEGVLIWAIFKFRGKPDDAEPKQIHGSTTVEIIWTIIPAVVLAIVAVPTVRAIFSTAHVPTVSKDGKKPLLVEVVGRQWFWEFKYPELGIVTSNELHVPVGRTVDLRMKSADVIHSFWIPQFVGKRDVFPNRETRLWMVADTVGAFPGACAEFCGIEHGRMDYYLMVDKPEEFDAWVARRQADSTLNNFGLPKPPAAGAAPAEAAPVDPLVAQGEKLFTTKGCMGCHTSNATYKGTMTGPNLSGVGTRKMIAAGWLPNTDENLKRWLQHTNEVKPGVFMKIATPVTDAEAAALIAYLRTKR